MSLIVKIEEAGREVDRPADFAHFVDPVTREAAVVVVLEGPLAGRTVQVPSRCIREDFTALAGPEALPPVWSLP
jgi:hypothetical protein